jgi:hypothetical protein
VLAFESSVATTGAGPERSPSMAAFSRRQATTVSSEVARASSRLDQGATRARPYCRASPWRGPKATAPPQLSPHAAGAATPPVPGLSIMHLSATGARMSGPSYKVQGPPPPLLATVRGRRLSNSY